MVLEISLPNGKDYIRTILLLSVNFFSSGFRRNFRFFFFFNFLSVVPLHPPNAPLLPVIHHFFKMADTDESEVLQKETFSLGQVKTITLDEEEEEDEVIKNRD